MPVFGAPDYTSVIDKAERMGLFDFLRRRPTSEPQMGENTAMRVDNPSWILVDGSSPEVIQDAVIEHSNIAKAELPVQHSTMIFRIDSRRFGVSFDPPAPPYAFANLIGWLDDPEMCRGTRGAIGWLVAPGDRTRFFLAPQRGNAGGDTLIGVAIDGRRVSVFLPDCSVSSSTARVEVVSEPVFPGADTKPVVTFEVTLDGNTSFGNPKFVVR